MPNTKGNPPARKERVIMRQHWRDLLFLHWRFNPEVIAPTLPPGLTLETYDGSAWMGIVPFRMEKIRPLGIPLPRAFSAFPEMNLRTYVRDADGRSGVWFYSLEAADRLAVWAARTFFHLNYRYAKMAVTREDDTITYTSQRHGDQTGKQDRYCWQTPQDKFSEASEGSLSHFLLERYRLFAWNKKKNQLHTGTVSHDLYRFREVKPSQWTSYLFELNGFDPVDRPPDSCLAAPGFQVKIHPMKKVGRECRIPIPAS